jgi:hypothetical protein
MTNRKKGQTMVNKSLHRKQTKDWADDIMCYEKEIRRKIDQTTSCATKKKTDERLSRWPHVLRKRKQTKDWADDLMCYEKENSYSSTSDTRAVTHFKNVISREWGKHEITSHYGYCKTLEVMTSTSPLGTPGPVANGNMNVSLLSWCFVLNRPLSVSRWRSRYETDLALTCGNSASFISNSMG